MSQQPKPIKKPTELLAMAGAILAKEGQQLDIYICGATCAFLRNWMPERGTNDCDVLDTAPPQGMGLGLGIIGGLQKDWLNISAQDYARDLPDDWETRARTQGPITFGGLRVFTLTREDFIASKIKAVYDSTRAHDHEDLLNMHEKPTEEELDYAEKNARERQDGRLADRQEAVLADLREEAAKERKRSSGMTR